MARQRSHSIAFNDTNIAPDAIRRVGVEPEDITGNRDDPIRFPSQQHRSVFGDLILPLLGRREVVGIDILQSDEDPRHAGAFCFFDEIRDLVTKRVNLNHHAKRNAFMFAQIDQAGARRTASTALRPPKAKEFDSAACIDSGRASFGT